MKLRRLVVAVAVPLVAGAVACSNRPYPAKSSVKSVRILAVHADLPYAHPGETSNLEALVIDGREEITTPMIFRWFPVQCISPANGQYYGCYPLLEAKYPDLGVDITSQLTEGFTYPVAIPESALDGIVPAIGRENAEPVTTSWTFMIACAGHVERRQRTTEFAENYAPFGCFGPDGKELPAEDGVFGFTRVTISQTSRNAQPTIKTLVFRGHPVDPSTGVLIPHCEKDFIDLHTNGNCDTYGMDVAFDDSDAEIDPDNLDANGHPGRETIYTDWFVSLGRFTEDRRIERDPFKGRPPVPNILYEPTRGPGKGFIWAVLHDNRGGTNWMSVPIEVR